MHIVLILSSLSITHRRSVYADDIGGEVKEEVDSSDSMQLPSLIADTKTAQVSGRQVLPEDDGANEEEAELKGIHLPAMKDMSVPQPRRDSIRVEKFFSPEYARTSHVYFEGVSSFLIFASAVYCSICNRRPKSVNRASISSSIRSSSIGNSSSSSISSLMHMSRNRSDLGNIGYSIFAASTLHVVWTKHFLLHFRCSMFVLAQRFI